MLKTFTQKKQFSGHATFARSWKEQTCVLFFLSFEQVRQMLIFSQLCLLCLRTCHCEGYTGLLGIRWNCVAIYWIMWVFLLFLSFSLSFIPSFYDLVVGIEDPDVFIPPPYYEKLPVSVCPPNPPEKLHSEEAPGCASRSQSWPVWFVTIHPQGHWRTIKAAITDFIYCFMAITDLFSNKKLKCIIYTCKARGEVKTLTSDRL